MWSCEWNYCVLRKLNLWLNNVVLKLLFYSELKILLLVIFINILIDYYKGY